MNAESISAASLVFVAAAYFEGGIKFEQSGKWITDMFTFNLERAYDDHLEGGPGNDVLIGQRGECSMCWILIKDTMDLWLTFSLKCSTANRKRLPLHWQWQ